MAGRDRPGSDDEPGPMDALARERAAKKPPSEEGDDSPDTLRLPRITRMPEGIEVIEERMGRASGQWILEVRCECGRRWFELEEIASARCPRCDKLVRVHIERAPAIRAR
jgi:hypothetical protein